MNELYSDAKSHYDRVTAAWTLLLGEDLHYGDFSGDADVLPEATRALTDRMMAAAAVGPADAVLDVGCGTGRPACSLAEETGATVMGITTSGVGVEQSRRRADAMGLSSRVSFAQRDGMRNGFPESSFDVAWVLESSHLMRDRAALVDECARVLRPGGRLVLCDIMLMKPMPFEEVRRLREPLALLRSVFGDARMETMAVYASLATDAGLDVTDTVDLTDATRPTFAAWRHNAHEHRETVEAQIGVDGWGEFVESSDVLDGFWDDGTLGYGLLRAAKP